MQRHLVTCQFTSPTKTHPQTGQPIAHQVVATTVVQGSLIDWYTSNCWQITFPDFVRCVILNVVTEDVVEEASHEDYDPAAAVADVRDSDCTDQPGQ